MRGNFSLFKVVKQLNIRGCPRESRRRDTQGGRRFPRCSVWESRPRGCIGKRIPRRSPRGTVRPPCRCGSCSSPALLLSSVQRGSLSSLLPGKLRGQEGSGQKEGTSWLKTRIWSLSFLNLEVLLALVVIVTLSCVAPLFYTALPKLIKAYFTWIADTLSARFSPEHLILQTLWLYIPTMFTN